MGGVEASDEVRIRSGAEVQELMSLLEGRRSGTGAWPLATTRGVALSLQGARVQFWS